MGEGRKIKSVDEILQQHLLLHSAHDNENIILLQKFAVHLIYLILWTSSQI